MNAARTLQRQYALLAAGGILFASQLPARAVDTIDGIPAVVVSGTVEPGYVRAKLPDGSIEPETYVFRRGVCLTGYICDNSFDNVTFKDVVRIAAVSLARQEYLPAKDPSQAKLLIEICWGTTAGPNQDEFRNAAFMGYDEILRKATECIGPARFRYDKYLDELKGSGSFGRYFVVLIAYDYQLMRARKVEKSLWMTRFGIPGRGNAFDQQVAGMAETASQYFGKATEGLVHEKLLSEGRVKIGEPKSLGEVPEK